MKYILPGLILLTACTAGNKPSETKQDPQQVNLESTQKETDMKLYPEIETFIETYQSNADTLGEERRQALNDLADYIIEKKQAQTEVNLTFICTHNSRRSHLSQIWAQTAAAYYGVDEDMNTFSGGTEATAFNPRAVAAVQRAGFKVDNPGGDNPKYGVAYSDHAPAMDCFSKTYDDEANADTNFAAIMTCSHADANCPYIPGAEYRLSVPYEDPKEADDTPEEATRYDERTQQIAAEMLYVMKRVSENL